MVILLKKFYCVKALLNINHPTNLGSLHSFLLLILLLLSPKNTRMTCNIHNSRAQMPESEVEEIARCKRPGFCTTY